MDSRVDKLIGRIEALEADAQGQLEKNEAMQTRMKDQGDLTDKLMSLTMKLIEDKLKERKDAG